MELGICFLDKGNPLQSWRWRFSKNQLVRCRLNRKQLIDHNVDWLERFEKIENIKSVFNKLMKRDWMHSEG